MMENDQKELNLLSLKIHMRALLSASQLYDRAILSLSLAVLGYIFVYVKHIPSINYKCLLILSCAFLIFSIISVLMSFIVDQYHCEHRVDYLQSIIENSSSTVSRSHWSDDWMSKLSIVSGVFFIVAITMFVIFLGTNL